jgi:hypothetical protein
VRRPALACLATIGIADYVIHHRSPSWLQVGALDEPAHLATAILLNEQPTRAYLIGALLPDLDHVPLVFRDATPGDSRPRTHSILTVLPALVVSRDLAAGMLAHFARDLALQPGAPMLWPVSSRSLRVPYALYAAAVTALAVRARRRGSRAR